MYPLVKCIRPLPTVSPHKWQEKQQFDGFLFVWRLIGALMHSNVHWTSPEFCWKKWPERNYSILYVDMNMMMRSLWLRLKVYKRWWVGTCCCPSPTWYGGPRIYPCCFCRWVPRTNIIRTLIQWGVNKIVSILQINFSRAFSIAMTAIFASLLFIRKIYRFICCKYEHIA